jgi:hypothetical protein
MPATERTAIREDGSPQTLKLRDGRLCELRNGCLVVASTREVLTGSHQTAGYVLEHAKLTNDERFYWSVWGAILCDRMSSQESHGQIGVGMRYSNRIKERMEAA